MLRSAWNSTGSANAACEASFGKGDAWQCFFGQNVAKFIKTPMFVLNRWVYDTPATAHPKTATFDHRSLTAADPTLLLCNVEGKAKVTRVRLHASIVKLAGEAGFGEDTFKLIGDELDDRIISDMNNSYNGHA